jgi:Kef-type K+ transport system membrane component KefB/nucleotide-binding universal stress UspA family protein
MRFVQPGEHQVLIFLVQIVLLLVTARLLGQVFRRFGQPAVVGELIAGVVLGPSVLGRLAPGVFDWIFPAGAVQSGMLFTVGWLCVILLLVVTGFETDLALIARLGKAAVLVTAGSLLVPFAFGLGGGYLAPDSLLGADVERSIFALFLAAALTISSLPVIAKILSELQLLRRNFGQLTLAVAMANDVIGWVLLGLIAGLAGSGRLDLGKLAMTLGGLVIFLGLAVAIGQRIVDAVLHQMRRRDVGIGGWVTMAVAIALGLGAITQALGVEAVLGAFIAGILLGRSRYARHEVEEQLETFTVAILAPIFFATAGLRVDLSLLGDPEIAVWALIVVAIASISKFLGSMIGARLSGLASREGMALGTALNARGALEIVIATVGLSLGVLNDASYTIVVIMAIVTSLMAPPILRWLVRDWVGTPEEQERLQREQQMAGKVLLRPGRVLVCGLSDGQRGEDGAAYAASILGRSLPKESPVTVVEPAENGADRMARLTEALGQREIETLHPDGDVVDVVLAQAALGYHLLATVVDVANTGELSEAADALVIRSKLPVVLIQPPPVSDAPIRRVLLPVSAALASRASSELAIAIAAGSGASLHLLHVHAESPVGPGRRILRTTLRSHERTVGSYAGDLRERILEIAEGAARQSGVSTERVTIERESRGPGIIDASKLHRSDVIVMGVAAQDIAGQVFLGQTTEFVLRNAGCAVVVVALGPT